MLLLKYDRQLRPWRQIRYAILPASGFSFLGAPGVFPIWTGWIAPLGAGFKLIVVPIGLIGVALWSTYRALAPLFLSEEAVRSDPEGLLVRPPLGGAVRIGWRELQDVAIQPPSPLLVRGHRLIFQARGRQVAVPIARTTTHYSRLESLRRDILAMRSAACGRDNTPNQGFEWGETSGDFDPDAVIARYLARKAETAATETCPAMPTPVAVPAPRGFGRKGL